MLFAISTFGAIGLAWAIDSTPTLPSSQQGWASISQTWSAVTCDWGQNYVTSTIDGVVFGRCCDNIFSNCGFGTRCDASTIYYHSTGYSTCKTGQTCNVMSIYDYAATETPVVDIFCWHNWPASTIFRYTTTEATTSTSATALQTTPTPAASLTTPFSEATASITSPSTSIKKQESKSWIAGAVIGPVAGCALIGALGFWLVRHNRNRKELNAQEAQYATGPYGFRTKLSPDVGPSPIELPGGRVQTEPSELESHHRY